MQTPLTILRYAAGIAGIAAIYGILVYVVEFPLPKVELVCDNGYREPISTDMNVCSAEAENRRSELGQHCGCTRPPHPFEAFYWFAGIPIVVGLAALVIPGLLPTRIGLMLIPVFLAYFGGWEYLLNQTPPPDPEASAFLFMFLVLHAVLATVVLVLVTRISNMIENRGANGT